jgi:hypothetical protein
MKGAYSTVSLLAALALSACASQQGPRSVATIKGVYSGTRIVSSGPVPADDAAMKQKPGTVRTHRTASATSKSNGTDTETQSTETTTVVGSSAVAAPDSEVKINNQ